MERKYQTQVEINKMKTNKTPKNKKKKKNPRLGSWRKCTILRNTLQIK